MLFNATVKIWINGQFKGTGFFISPDGYVLTAYHCIGLYPSRIEIETRFNGKFVAQLDNSKSLPAIKYDIAVLKVSDIWSTMPTECLPLGLISNQHVSDDIVALGYSTVTNSEDTQIGFYFGRILRLCPDNRFDSDAIKSCWAKWWSGLSLCYTPSHRFSPGRV